VVPLDRKAELPLLVSLFDPIVDGIAECTTLAAFGSRGLAQIHHRPIAGAWLLRPTGTCRALSQPLVQQLCNGHGAAPRDNVLAAIPCFNEEVSIGSVVLKARAKAAEVLVVDDGSADCTARVAENAGATVISHQINFGKAAGVRTSIDYALRNNYDVLVLLDGDGQHDPDEIPTIAAPILHGEADLVIGSRFIDPNGSVPSYRRIGQTILNAVTNAQSSFKTTDSQSGFRALSRRAMKEFDIASDGYAVESDMLSRLSAGSSVIREVPITAIYDVPFKHKKNPFSHGYDILAKILGDLGNSRPLLLFGLSGSVMSVFGIGFGFWAFSTYYGTNKWPFLPTIAAGVFMGLGLLLIFTGFIINSLILMMKKRV
jgi:glycosyltransferase involved in cell wall biosynthesis